MKDNVMPFFLGLNSAKKSSSSAGSWTPQPKADQVRLHLEMAYRQNQKKKARLLPVRVSVRTW
jgi:hypothetical protein